MQSRVNVNNIMWLKNAIQHCMLFSPLKIQTYDHSDCFWQFMLNIIPCFLHVVSFVVALTVPYKTVSGQEGRHWNLNDSLCPKITLIMLLQSLNACANKIVAAKLTWSIFSCWVCNCHGLVTVPRQPLLMDKKDGITFCGG